MEKSKIGMRHIGQNQNQNHRNYVESRNCIIGIRGSSINGIWVIGSKMKWKWDMRTPYWGPQLKMAVVQTKLKATNLMFSWSKKSKVT